VRVTDVTLVDDGEVARLAATVTTERFSAPMDIWFAVPSVMRSMLCSDRADPWLSALLLPAMRLGEPLEIEAAVSSELAAAVGHLQTVYRTWLPSTSTVPVRTGARFGPPRDAGHRVGLFFSCGVDSWYSLLRTASRVARGHPGATDLICVHGIDIDVGPRKQGVAEQLFDNTRRAADEFGLGAVTVSTNIRRLYSRLGVSWRWGQSGALAGIGFALQQEVGTFLIAAGHPNSFVIEGPGAAGAAHPLLMPMFSTAQCEFAVHGVEVDRLAKVGEIVHSPLALDTLRVCWANHRLEYNCGRCAKCIRTMLELEICDALDRCSTMPDHLVPDDVAQAEILFSYDVQLLAQRLDRLRERECSSDVIAGLSAAVERGKRRTADIGAAVEVVRAVVPLDEHFAVLDDDGLRFDLIATHRRADPFPERDGYFNGLPSDDQEAISELDRLCRTGVRKLVVWRDAFWVLDLFAGFHQQLRSTCPVVAESPEVIIFDLVPTSTRPPAEPASTGTGT
jgi:hypothetical protein